MDPKGPTYTGAIEPSKCWLCSQSAYIHNLKIRQLFVCMYYWSGFTGVIILVNEITSISQGSHNTTRYSNNLIAIIA